MKGTETDGTDSESALTSGVQIGSHGTLINGVLSEARVTNRIGLEESIRWG